MSLLSDRWYRIAGMVPRWRTEVRVDRQVSRGQRWYLLSDGAAGKTVRLDDRAYAIVGRCDGRSTFEQVWQAALADDPTEVASQSEVLTIVSGLVADGFLDCDGWPDLEVLRQQADERQRRRRRQRMNPLALRIALVDPSGWLSRCGGLSRVLFGVPGAVAWLALIGLALVVLLGHVDGLWTDARRTMSSPQAWLIAWLVFAPMKFVHEAAHALAVRRFGGTVHEAGMGLVMFLPAPYVDASEANRFVSPTARALVSAAGILAELALAAIGLLVWVISEPGLTHQVALVVLMVGSVSTLLFNANPLTRMDGYHFLADLAQLPNLATRSASWWRERLLSYWLSIRSGDRLETAPREVAWLALYAPLAWGYRLMMAVWLSVWLGSLYAPAGVAMAVLSVGATVLLPLWRLVQAAQAQAVDLRSVWQVRGRAAAGIVLLALVTLVVPVPDRLVVRGVVWVPEPSQIRAGDDGFVALVQAADGQMVRVGQPVLHLTDPQLLAEAQRLEAKRVGIEVSRFGTLIGDPARGQQLLEELSQVDDARARLQERLVALASLAPTPGRLSLPHAADLPGRFFKRGERIADVLDSAAPTVRLVLAQHQITRLREGVQAVRLGFAHEPWRAVAADLLRDTPAPVDKLPSAALGSEAGGPIDVDPTDKDGLKPAQPTYVVDVRARQEIDAYPGERVDVSLDCGWSPLAAQMVREVRQTFRARFAPEPV